MKEVFTTSEAARICKVSQQTIIRCFDAGKIKGFHVPGSRFRRIPREDLIRFAQEYGISINAFETAPRQVLIVSSNEEFVKVVAPRLQSNPRLGIRVAADGFETGYCCRDQDPEVVALDFHSADFNAAALSTEIHRRLPKARIVTFASGSIGGNSEPGPIADAAVDCRSAEELIAAIDRCFAA